MGHFHLGELGSFGYESQKRVPCCQVTTVLFVRLSTSWDVWILQTKLQMLQKILGPAAGRDGVTTGIHESCCIKSILFTTQESQE